MVVKVPICRWLRPGPASRLLLCSPRTPRLGTLSLRVPAWSSPRPGETWLRAETLRVAEHQPLLHRPSRFPPGWAPACLHCSPAVRSCAWCPEQLGGGPRTSQRGGSARPGGSGTLLRGREWVSLASRTVGLGRLPAASSRNPLFNSSLRGSASSCLSSVEILRTLAPETSRPTSCVWGRGAPWHPHGRLPFTAPLVNSGFLWAPHLPSPHPRRLTEGAGGTSARAIARS